MDAGPPMSSPAPISPEERGRTNLERMQQHAHLARLCCLPAIPLTLLAQRTGATTANAGRIHHAQTAINALSGVPGHEAIARLDSAASHRVGVENRLR